MKKKALSLILASAMVLSLAACGSDGGPGDNTGSAGEETSKGDTANAETPDDGAADSNAASASDMNIAMITDSGDITDQSFNQTTYESCKAWAEINDVPLPITNRTAIPTRQEAQVSTRQWQAARMSS